MHTPAIKTLVGFVCYPVWVPRNDQRETEKEKRGEGRNRKTKKTRGKKMVKEQEAEAKRRWIEEN